MSTKKPRSSTAKSPKSAKGPSKSPAKQSAPEDTPAPAVLKELKAARKCFQTVVKAYMSRVDGEIAEVEKAIAMMNAEESLPQSRVHDLRDILMLLRKVQIKAEKGRRKDIKKMDSLVSDLRGFLDHWA